MYREDTIAAVATPPGEGGLAVVRISGPDAEAIAGALFFQAKRRAGEFRSHKLYHGEIRDPRSGRVRDEVLLTVMRRPHSYTGEDVVEVHCHGGTLVVREILGLILSQGARHAEPGEFTKRAFLNGRIDLVQAEGILDLVRARTREAANLAIEQVGGGVSAWVDQIRNSLLDIMVQVEAAIDFPEEEIELVGRRELEGKIAGLKQQIGSAIASYDSGRLYRDGAKVCICGRPNVGKSSLLNSILGEERIIVTPIAGTTRDVIEESVNIGGLPVVFWDTAGLREADDQAERIGVDLAKRHMAKADLALLVLDGSESFSAEDQSLVEAMLGKALFVVNKSDLPRRLEVSRLAAAAGNNVHAVSAKVGTGIEELKNALRERLLDTPPESPVVITNIRHRSALFQCEKALERGLNSVRDRAAPEFISVDLSEAREALEEITGVIETDDILERIFMQFCIGK